MNKLLLVDGNSLINRAYYATSLTNGASYGFLNMFLKEIQDTRCTHVAVAFDVRAKTFRHELFDEYKAHRKPMPDDLARQLFDLKELLAIMGITIFEKPGFEADDILGSLGCIVKKDFHTIILTADRDLLQLVDDNVSVYLTKTGVTRVEVYTPARIHDEFGITPVQLIDVKALMGDKSDNIPGAQGIGEKTALKIIKQFGNIETYLKNTPRDDTDIIFKSKQLSEIKCDMDIPFDPGKLEFSLPMSKDVFNAFKSRHFYSLCNRDGLFETTGMPVQQSFI